MIPCRDTKGQEEAAFLLLLTICILITVCILITICIPVTVCILSTANTVKHLFSHNGSGLFRPARSSLRITETRRDTDTAIMIISVTGWAQIIPPKPNRRFRSRRSGI